MGEATKAEVGVPKPQDSVQPKKQRKITALDRVCPRLTDDEEDQLLLASSRSPEVLGALALLHSARRGEFVDEALAKDPNCLPALWAGSFLDDEPSKRLEQAKHLCELEPNNTAARLAAATSSARLKDMASAVAFLKAAALSPEDLVDPRARWGELMRKQYRDAGRSSDQALARVELQRSQVEVGAMSQLGKAMGMVEWNFKRGEEFIEPQLAMLTLYQMINSGTSFDLVTKTAAAGRENSALIALAEASTTVDVSKYLDEPLEKVLADSQASLFQIQKVGSAGQRVDEIYEALPLELRAEFLDRSKQSGQVGALLWLHSEKPDYLTPPLTLK